MISIIICARSGTTLEELAGNIRATIGVPYELVVIDNTGNRYSIFEAYNLGVARSTHPYLCFMHDDIHFHGAGWGKNVVAHLEKPGAGIIGLAGPFYLSAVPSPWWSQGHYTEQYYFKRGGEGDLIHRIRGAPASGSPSEVVAVDGFWFCAPRQLFNSISFDERGFSPFHFYDLDICMQARVAGASVQVVYDVLVEHRSFGTLNRQWVSSALAFGKKWRAVLPASTVPFSKAAEAQADTAALAGLRDVMASIGCSARQINGTLLRLLPVARGGLLRPRAVKLLAKWLLNKA